MAKDRRQLSREQIREYLEKSDESGTLDADQVEDQALKQLAKTAGKTDPKKKKKKRLNAAGKTIATRVSSMTGAFTGTIAGTLRAEFDDREFKNRIKGFSIGAAVATLVILVLSIVPATFIEKPTHDAKMKLRPVDPPQTPTFMHLDIDDKSIDTVGRFPWDRTAWAWMVHGATEAGIDRIVFDVEFYNRQDVAAEGEKIREAAIKSKDGTLDAESMRDLTVDHDANLAAAIKECQNVYLPFHFNADGNEIRSNKRAIDWNEELFEKLMEKIEAHGETKKFDKLSPAHMIEIFQELDSDKISEEAATKAASDGLSSVINAVLFRHIHGWYAERPELLAQHMQEWLRDWREARDARAGDVLAKVSDNIGAANRWVTPALAILHRCYSWHRFIDGIDFADDPWVLPPEIVDGYDPDDYDSFAIKDSANKPPIPFYTDFEFRPALFTLGAYAKGAGFVSIDPDFDGIIREVPLVALYRNSATKEDRLFLQLAFYVLLRETNADMSSIRIELGSHVTFRADPKLMARHQNESARESEESEEEDGLKEYRFSINERGFLTINWAGDTSQKYGDIFSHVPVTNLVNIGSQLEGVQEIQDGNAKFVDSWSTTLTAFVKDSNKASLEDYFFTERLYKKGEGTRPSYSELGYQLAGFASKLAKTFPTLTPEERHFLLKLVRDSAKSSWLEDPEWWIIDSSARNKKARALVPTLVPKMHQAFVEQFPAHKDRAETTAIFSPKERHWSSTSGFRGVLRAPLPALLFPDKGAVLPLLGPEGLKDKALFQEVKSELLDLTLALDFASGNISKAAQHTKGKTCPAAFEEDSEFGKLLEQRRSFALGLQGAIPLLLDLEAKDEDFAQALESAGISGPATLMHLEPLLAERKSLLVRREASMGNFEEKLALRESKLAKAKAVVGDAVDGKFGLVGASATGLGDIWPTPMHEKFPGPGVHSNLFNTLVHGEELSDAPKQSLLIVVLFVFAVCFTAARLNVIGGIVSFGILVFAYLTLDSFVQAFQRSFLDTTRNLSALFAPFLVIQVFRYTVEYKAKNRIKGQFAKFLSPQAVEQIQDNPDFLKLGGDEAEMCVYFSDIAGFTPISETMTAPRLIDWLNEYMTTMCEPIRASDGYVDKFIGDAVMAFWGKPNPLTDYSARGCKCAVQVKQLLLEFNRESLKRGIPEAGTRIGLASGPFVAGNMGTEWKINFTAIGDTVNLGARLEGANKQYGTQIMINQLCYQQAEDIILAHQLDTIAVKGKKKGVPVYHLISTRDIAEPDHVKGAQIYSEAFDTYQRQEWKLAHEGFRESKEFLPKPYLVSYGPYDVMMDRCSSLMDADSQKRMEILGLDSIDAEWDGVFKMTSK